MSLSSSTTGGVLGTIQPTPDPYSQTVAAWVLLAIFIVVSAVAIWMNAPHARQRLHAIQESVGCGGELGDPCEQPNDCPPRAIRVFYLVRRNSFLTVEYVAFSLCVSQLFVAIFMQIFYWWPTNLQSQANAGWVLFAIFLVISAAALYFQEPGPMRQLREIRDIRQCTEAKRHTLPKHHDSHNSAKLGDNEMLRAARFGTAWQ